jgi:hypothetical protein
VYFYELHEGDDDLFADLLLAREDEIPPDIFFEIVQDIRRRVQDTFEQDTLIEAIAEELEREHGFVFISEDRLTAAVNVSLDEEENFLADVSGADEEEEADEAEEADAAEFAGDFRTIVADIRGGESND